MVDVLDKATWLSLRTFQAVALPFLYKTDAICVTNNKRTPFHES